MRLFLPYFLLALVGATASRSAVTATPVPPPLAQNAGDVVRTTVSNFATVGGFGFAFTAVKGFADNAGVQGGARAAVPYFVLKASLINAQRWGRISAGFAGGRAAGQWLRGADDRTTAMMGSVAGGVAAATSVSQIPSSVATFACFGYFLDSFSAKPEDDANGPTRTAPVPKPVKRGLTPGQKLDRMLGITPDDQQRALAGAAGN